MATMTEEEITEEIERMTMQHGDWPLYPMLPVKHRERKVGGGMPELGLVFAGKPIVYVGLNMHETNAGDLEDAPKEVYHSWEDLVKAGWVGD